MVRLSFWLSSLPVLTSTLRVSPRSVTGLSLASLRNITTLFFSPVYAGAAPSASNSPTTPTAAAIDLLLVLIVDGFLSAAPPGAAEPGRPLAGGWDRRRAVRLRREDSGHPETWRRADPADAARSRERPCRRGRLDEGDAAVPPRLGPAEGPPDRLGGAAEPDQQGGHCQGRHDLDQEADEQQAVA